MSSSMPGLEALLPTTEDMSDASGLQSAPAGTNQLHTVVTSGSSDVVSSNDDSTRRTLLDLRQEKKMRRKGVGGQERPLQLLDLPVDVLKEIVKEVTYTNDLTSLALTCWALHGLATPWIYSRFDIVWPDAQSDSDSRQVVDALTYGLATLVMGDEPVNTLQTAEYNHSFFCGHCGLLNVMETSPGFPARVTRRRRRGNYYPQYTRRFSLGNGPDEWVKEYLINRESGKMLGTLVALALARMPQLDTFVWDMPTGILRDCWSALSLVREGQGNPRCTPSCLQKVWVRFHDNREILDGPDGLPTASQGTQLSPGHTPGPSQTQSSQSPTPLEWSYRHIEHPSFSVLPPLRSLNVLNVDEIAYLEEMSVLIKRSLGSLRELRVGLASTVAQKGFASARDLNVPIGDDEPTEYQQVLRRLLGKLAKGEDEDHGSATGYDVLTTPVAPIAGEHHVSGSKNLLIQPGPAAPSNIVTSKNRSNNPALLSGIAPKAASGGLTTSDPAGILVDLVIQTNHGPISGRSTTSELVAPLLSSPGEDGPYDPDAVAPNAPTETARSTARSDQVGTTGVPDASKSSTSLIADSSEREADEKRLKLQTLELEYVDLDAGVLLTAVDWTVLTTLTLLNCDSQERLWKMLRRAFTPRPSTSQPMLRRKSKMHLRDLSSLDSLATPRSEYRINLRRIHTNCVSSALMAFLKETLAPNSLEWLFLQDGAIISHPTEPGSISKYDSNVSVEAICRGPLRRHRLSLKKLLIDSDNRLIDRQRRTPKWRKWVLDRDALSFLTGGKMSALREVSIAMDYRDWHFLLQRLPHVPHIRSLHIHHVADHPYGHHVNAKELALQLMDIVSLRREMELCYAAIANKCFEILEGTADDDTRPPVHHSPSAPANPGLPGPDDANSSDEESNDDEDEADDEENDDGIAPGNAAGDDSDLDSHTESLELSDDETGLDGRAKPPRLKLREILFYDDKVSIFAARHGKI